MTDFSPFKPTPDLPLGLGNALAPLAPTSNGLSPGPDQPEDSIKCICGFDGDDGNTVYCELCKTWQHIECYYPRNDGADVPDVPEIHECVSCTPRHLDIAGARERQLQLRALPPLKTKRALNKGQKRRGKDSLQMNGLRTDGHDRNSGSPRDQPPPAKKPKTSHKSSASTSAAHTQHRRRTGSTTTGRAAAKRLSSPHNPHPHYSREFLQLYKNDYSPIQSNSFASIAVSNALSSWLTDPESLAEVTTRSHQEIFSRWDKPFEELEETSPGFTETTEEANVSIDSAHPIAKKILVDHDVDETTFIGELTGQIGLRQDYVQDASNRWGELRHPEPFVFFLDTLPVYIDCRREGNALRHVRRSCDPNAKIQIIILSTVYHFCLVSTKSIAAGEEIMLGWSLDTRPFEIIRDWKLKGAMSEEDEAHMCDWTSRVLSNFGGCACNRSNACPLWRFDRRMPPNAPLQERPGRGKKGKRLGNQISPLSTGKATNSRAGSEPVNNGDIDDDAMDTRSVSASSRSKPTSRDNTPSVAGGVEMSERERRKMMQQERLFDRLERDDGKKKKRNSAGSTANTPAAVSSKPFSDTSNPPLAPAQPNTRTRANGVPQPRPVKPAINGTPIPVRQKPVYIDSSMQTEEKNPPETAPAFKKPRCRGSFAQRLLRRAEEQRKQKMQEAERKPSLPASSPTSSKSGSILANDAAAMPPPPLPRVRSSSPRPPSTKAEPEDTEMTDVDVKQEPATVATTQTTDSAMQGVLTSPTETSATQPNPPPPWPSASPSATTPEPSEKPITPKTPDLHIQVPPPAPISHPVHTPTTPSITGSVIPQSPSALSAAPLFSPSVATNAQQSSPVARTVKRTSLADYMARRKKESAAAAASESGALASSPTEKTAAAAEAGQPPPASLPASSSTAIEEADIPLPPVRPLNGAENENRPSDAARP